MEIVTGKKELCRNFYDYAELNYKFTHLGMKILDLFLKIF